MSKLEQLYLCVISGQLSPRQIVAAMNDPAFKAYYKQRK